MATQAWVGSSKSSTLNPPPMACCMAAEPAWCHDTPPSVLSTSPSFTVSARARVAEKATRSSSFPARAPLARRCHHRGRSSTPASSSHLRRTSDTRSHHRCRPSLGRHRPSISCLRRRRPKDGPQGDSPSDTGARMCSNSCLDPGQRATPRYPPGGVAPFSQEHSVRTDGHLGDLIRALGSGDGVPGTAVVPRCLNPDRTRHGGSVVDGA